MAKATTKPATGKKAPSSSKKVKAEAVKSEAPAKAARKPLTRPQVRTAISRGRIDKVALDAAFKFRIYEAALPINVDIPPGSDRPVITIGFVQRQRSDMREVTFKVSPECYQADLKNRKGGEALHFMHDVKFGVWHDTEDENAVSAICIMDSYQYVKGVDGADGKPSEVFSIVADAETGVVLPKNFPAWARQWQNERVEQLVQALASAESYGEGDKYLSSWKVVAGTLKKDGEEITAGLALE